MAHGMITATKATDRPKSQVRLQLDCLIDLAAALGMKRPFPGTRVKGAATLPIRFESLVLTVHAALYGPSARADLNGLAKALKSLRSH
ncbi:MAG: hypothetical protein B7Y99_08080 [Caulobacterales bacterium 32-69-10]|nr:MAG: hypothetical protein B7Y99_08080 [Caulobacterales bacterium 32-69-10]